MRIFLRQCAKNRCWDPDGALALRPFLSLKLWARRKIRRDLRGVEQYPQLSRSRLTAQLRSFESIAMSGNADPSSAVTSTPSIGDPNQHIQEYLDYYISFQYPPHYAVLLTGAWGIGKTFLIRKILDAHYNDKKEKYIYVSLYGLSSFEELDRALRAALFPYLNNKTAIVSTKVAKAALGLFKVSTDLNLGDFTSKFKDALYVFDDLERCALPLQKVMGYINEFVEQDNCKVIIIANEGAIKERPEYLERREKTVGKVLEVQSSINEAFAHFLSRVADEATKTFYGSQVEKISLRFKQSRLENLRILQQTMWDFERVYKIVEPSSQVNAVAMGALLDLFFSLSFEVKCGRLSADDIAGRQNAQLFSFLREKKDGTPPTLFEESAKRYSDVDLTDVIISSEALIDILFKGVIDSPTINECIRASHYFANDYEPPWRLVWHFMDRPEAEVEAALVQMERQFADHAFLIPGEILHVFGLRLWAAGAELMQISREEAFESGKAYVDYLFENGLLDVKEPETRMARLGGYGGLAIYEKDTKDFRDLYLYLNERRAEAKRARHPTWGVELLADMQNDQEAFFSRIAPQSGASTPFYEIPVLASVNPVEFVRILMSLEPAAQKGILMALSGRYEYGALEGRLKDEALWLKTMHKELLGSLACANALTKTRFEQLLRWYIDEPLAALEAVDDVVASFSSPQGVLAPKTVEEPASERPSEVPLREI